MKYLYKSLNVEVDAVQYKDDDSVDDVIEFAWQRGASKVGDSIRITAGPEQLCVDPGYWLVKCPQLGMWVEHHRVFSEKFEPIRKMRVVRKNNKNLLKRRGKGFWGRALAVQFGDNYLVLQNKRGAGRETAVVTYCDFEPTEKEIYRLRQLFLKKYKCELGKLISFDQFCGAVQNGQQFYREFEPVSKQTKLEL